MPSLLMIQWGVVGFFVLIHFLLGFMRGTSKSTYFTIVSIVMTFVTLWLVSLMSINALFVGGNTFQSYINMIAARVGFTIPTEVSNYLFDPAITPFIIAIIDLVIRIIGFFSLYPIIKGFFTLIIFKPIWKRVLLPILLKKQNDRQAQRFEERNNGKQKFVPAKRLRKNIFSRFGGGLMGGLRGAVVAFVFLLPLLVMASFIDGFGDILPIQSSNGSQALSGGDQELVAIPGLDGALGDMLADYLAQIDEMNANGLTSITSQIVINGKPLERYLFDMVFTTKVVEEDKVTEINWAGELESILGVGKVILESGFLEEGFQVEDISKEHLPYIEQLFTHIGNSDLLGYMIPFATRYGVENLLPDMVGGVNIYEREKSKAAIDEFVSIDWSVEFNNIYGIAEAVLEFGSVSELMVYANNPELIAELSPEEGAKLANIFRALGNMETLSLISAALDLATTMDQVKEQIQWIAPEEVEEYLQDRLAFIIDDPKFFTGDSGEIYRIADFIEAIFTDEFGDVDLTAFLNASADPEAFAEAQNEEWINNLFVKLVDIQLLIESIPMGVDFGLYTASGSQVSAELAEEMAIRLEEIDWEAEILNIGEIYTEALKIGVTSLLGENPQYYAIIDDVAINHMDGIRTIVSKIFEDSALVSAAIEIASPMLVETMIEDPELKEIALNALMSDPDSGEVDFNFGQEFNNVLTIVESIYKFTTISELNSFSTMTLDQKVELFAGFGSLNNTEYNTFKSAFENLQILNRADVAALDYAKARFEVEQLYVPEEIELGSELTSIIGFVYYAAKYTHENANLYNSFEEIDFAPLFADEVFRSHILPTNLENHSNFLLANIAHNLKHYSNDVSISQYLALPQAYLDASPESELWMDELNALLGSVFDLAASFEDSTVLTLSLRDMTLFAADPTSASIELITQFADLTKAEEAFGSLDSSVILRTSIKTAIDTFGATTAATLGGYEVKTPEIAKDGEMLELGVLVDLINGLAKIVDDLNNTWNYTSISQMTADLSANAILPAYNNLADETLLSFGEIILLKGVISELLLSEDFQAFGVQSLNDAQETMEVPADFLELAPEMLDADGVKGEEIGKLFISIKSLQLASTEELSSFGPNTLSALIDRNVVGTTDDLDRFFDSGFIYTLLDKVIQLDVLSNFANDALSGAFGDADITIDLTPHPASLGNAIDHEPIEVGRVTKQEFRNIIVSLSLLGDFSTIGIGTFVNMADPTAETDDFTTFLASDFIYVVLGRLFENEGFGEYVGGMLSGAFGDGIDLDMGAPVDALGTTGVEEDIMTRVEMRNLMVSFKLIGLDESTDIQIPAILGMLGQNEDIDGEDDFDRFLKSKYIADKLSILLLSDAVIELLAADRFTPVDFVMPASSYTTIGDRDRLTNDELYNLFNGLNILGLSELEGSSFNIEQITSLSPEEIENVLDSSYLYVTIDLMLKSETSLSLPADVFETAGEFDGMVKKVEIINVFGAFDVLGTSNPADIDINAITIADIQALLDLNSIIIDQMISDAIVDALTSVPATAYNAELTRLTKDEMNNMVQVLLILADGDDQQTLVGLTPIDTSTITRDKLRDFYELDSRLVDRILSEAIIDSGISIHSLSYDDASEVDEFDNKLDLKRSELGALIDALDILEIDINNAGAIDLNTFTPEKIEELLDLDSNLIYRLVGEGIIDQNLQTDESLAADGIDANYDPEAPGSDLKVSEMYALVAAMQAMGITSLGMTIDVNTTTIAQLQALHYIGLGIDPVLDTHQSVIVHRLLSEAIIGALTVPSGAYMVGSTLDLLPNEIQGVIGSLLVLSEGDDQETLNGLTPVDTSVLTPDAIEDLLDLDSLIIYRMVASGIIDQNLHTDESLAELGDDNYDENAIGEDLKISEMYGLVEAMRVMGITDLGTTIDIDATTIAQLQELHYVGLGIDPVLDTHQSLIVHRLLSEAIIGALTIPSGAYMVGSTLDLKPEEIQGVIGSLLVLSGGDDQETLNGLTPVDTSVLTPDAIEDLLDLDSLIIYRMVASGIIDQNLHTDESLAELGDDNYDENAIGDDLKISEMYGLVEAMRVMGITDLGTTIVIEDTTIAQLQELHYVGLGIDPGTDVHQSVIVHRLLSEAIIGALTIPSGAYMVGSTLDLKPEEIQGVIGSLLVLSAGDDQETLNGLTPVDTTVLTPAAIDDLLDLDSLIIYRLIATGIIDQNLQTDESLAVLGDVNYDPDLPGADLKVFEMRALVDAMEIMGIVNLGTTIAAENTTIANLQDLHDVGLRDAGIDDLDSTIVHRLLSNAISASLTIPTNAFMVGSTEDLFIDGTRDEIQGVIDAMLLLSGGDDQQTLVSLTPVANSVLTPALIKSLLDIDTLIIHRMIASGIITATLDTDESHAELGDPNYDPNAIGEDIKVSEMYALVEAMNIMGITDLSVAIDAQGVTIAQLQNLHYVGLGTDPVDDEFDSVIVHRILSDAIIAALDIPSTAYMVGSTLDLLAVEVQGVIDAMLVLNGGDDSATLLDLTPIDNTLLTAAVLQDLIDIDKLIVYRLISAGIIAANIDTDESYAELGDDNYDPLAINDDIKIAEMQHIVDSMDILGVTSIMTIASDITVAGLKALTPAEIEILVEANTSGPNTIIYYIISETVDPDNNLYDTLVVLYPGTYTEPADDYYVLDGFSNRLRLKRTSIADAINELP